MIRGELSHDIGFLKGEIRRLASLSKDLKKRRTNLIDDAIKDEKDFAADYQNLTQRKLSQPDFNKKTRERLTKVEQELRSFVIEDTMFDKELGYAKDILEQFRKQFPGMANVIPLADAEFKITMAEVYLTARLKACQTFIQNTLDPLMRSKDLKLYARMLETVFSNICEFARDIDDATLKAMGQILKFYGILLQKYPLLIKIIEKERWAKDRRTRVFE